MQHKTPDPETLMRAGMHGAQFDWRDPLRLDSLLTPEEVLIRDTARGTRPSTSR